MIVHRGAERIVQCDWCFRVCPSPEALRKQWRTLPEHGLGPARASASHDAAGHAPAREVVTPAQPAHACPMCLSELGADRFPLPALRDDAREG